MGILFSEVKINEVASSPRWYQHYRLVSVVRDCAGIPAESDTHILASILFSIEL